MLVNFEISEPDITGWASTSPIFRILITEVRPKHIIEVGTWKGASAIHMASIIKELNLPCTISCVDTWLGALEFFTTLKGTPERSLNCKFGYPTVYYQFLYNIKSQNHEDIIFPYPMTSNIAAKVFSYENIKADLIYIDGSHEYDDVTSDLKNYYQLLNTKGIIFGDNDANFPGSQQAHSDFISASGKPPETYENFWIIRK